MTHANTPLSAELMIDKVNPTPTCSMGWGSKNRWLAAHTMPSDATTIKMPSKPEEKYSAL
jgi:hypothetical protein